MADKIYMVNYAMNNTASLLIPHDTDAIIHEPILISRRHCYGIHSTTVKLFNGV